MITRRLFTALAASSVLAVAACSAGADATSQQTEYDAAGFKERMAKEGTVILDVRTPEEFAAGHIPGAINLDVQSPTFADDVASLDNAVPYAVYCRSDNRSQVALDIMTERGFEAFHLAGGIGAWQSAGYDIVS